MSVFVFSFLFHEQEVSMEAVRRSLGLLGGAARLHELV